MALNQHMDDHIEGKLLECKAKKFYVLLISRLAYSINDRVNAFV